MSLNFYPSFCLVGYSPQKHWIEKKISRVTSSTISHVGFRISVCNKEYETYILTRPTDTFVPVRKIEKILPPPTIQTPWFSSQTPDWPEKIAKISAEYGKAGIISSGFYHYIGRYIHAPIPKTCTDLVWKCCSVVGIDLTERFYPHKLIKEFYQCML